MLSMSKSGNDIQRNVKGDNVIVDVRWRRIIFGRFKNVIPFWGRKDVAISFSDK